MGKIIDAVVLVLYPVIAAVGMTYFGIRTTAVVLLLLLGRRIFMTVLKNREGTRVVLYHIIIMTLIIGVAGVVRSPLALRIAPFMVSLSVITMFAGSLRTTPIIERFARLQKPDLPDEEITYCRTLTKIWILVMAANSALIFGAAFIDDNVTWSIIVGPVSYSLLGVVFAVEYPYRKWRFQDFSPRNPIDRLLRPILKNK